ncbi:MAG: hypothetical protein JRI76_11555 [Deltaproteobacteria bacterium]|nr:hypothetical protein [Deltaproteobacteria bacterium]
MMERQVYAKVLRKPALWTGPCPVCGKKIRAGNLIRQPFSRGTDGHNSYAHYWMCHACALELHTGWAGTETRRSYAHYWMCHACALELHTGWAGTETRRRPSRGPTIH